MLLIFDFRCEDGHVHEHLVRDDTRSWRCPTCEQPSERLISPVRSKLDHTFPGEAMKWEKKHEEGAKIKTP